MRRGNKKIKIKSQRGDVPVGQILLIGAIIIPLIIILIMFKSELAMFLFEEHSEMMIEINK